MNKGGKLTWAREGELYGRADAREEPLHVDFFGGRQAPLDFWIDNTEGVESGRVLGWDEGAINAGVADIVGCPEEHRDTFYRAYARGALAEAWVIRRELPAGERPRAARRCES